MIHIYETAWGPVIIPNQLLEYAETLSGSYGDKRTRKRRFIEQSYPFLEKIAKTNCKDKTANKWAENYIRSINDTKKK